MDARKKSASEVLTNMAISYPIHFISNYFILPFYASDIVAADGDWIAMTVPNLWLGVWFSIISFLRQYGLRRLYERLPKDATTLFIFKKLLRVV